MAALQHLQSFSCKQCKQCSCFNFECICYWSRSVFESFLRTSNGRFFKLLHCLNWRLDAIAGVMTVMILCQRQLRPPTLRNPWTNSMPWRPGAFSPESPDANSLPRGVPLKQGSNDKWQISRIIWLRLSSATTKADSNHQSLQEKVAWQFVTVSFNEESNAFGLDMEMSFSSNTLKWPMLPVNCNQVEALQKELQQIARTGGNGHLYILGLGQADSPTTNDWIAGQVQKWLDSWAGSNNWWHSKILKHLETMSTISRLNLSSILDHLFVHLMSSCPTESGSFIAMQRPDEGAKQLKPDKAQVGRCAVALSLENAGELVAGDFPHPADPCRLWIPASGRNYTRPVCWEQVGWTLQVR